MSEKQYEIVGGTLQKGDACRMYLMRGQVNPLNQGVVTKVIEQEFIVTDIAEDGSWIRLKNPAVQEWPPDGFKVSYDHFVVCYARVLALCKLPKPEWEKNIDVDGDLDIRKVFENGFHGTEIPLGGCGIEKLPASKRKLAEAGIVYARAMVGYINPKKPRVLNQSPRPRYDGWVLDANWKLRLEVRQECVRQAKERRKKDDEKQQDLLDHSAPTESPVKSE
jgi:hypothetical protein